jgi:hypothetical protein
MDPSSSSPVSGVFLSLACKLLKMLRVVGWEPSSIKGSDCCAQDRKAQTHESTKSTRADFVQWLSYAARAVAVQDMALQVDELS